MVLSLSLLVLIAMAGGFASALWLLWRSRPASNGRPCCPSCGERLLHPAKFCGHCGARLT